MYSTCLSVELSGYCDRSLEALWLAWPELRGFEAEERVDGIRLGGYCGMPFRNEAREGVAEEGTDDREVLPFVMLFELVVVPFVGGR